MTNPKIEMITRLYLSYRPDLARIIRSVLRDQPDEVEDVLQDVWIKTARAVDTIRSGSTRLWMRAIARNAALNWLRHTKRRPDMKSSRYEDEEDGIPDKTPLPDDLTERRVLHEALTALDGHAPKQAAAVYLIYIGGLTYLEAANALQVSEGTVKSNAHKGIERLSVSLGHLKAA